MQCASEEGPQKLRAVRHGYQEPDGGTHGRHKDQGLPSKVCTTGRCLGQHVRTSMPRNTQLWRRRAWKAYLPTLIDPINLFE